MCSEKQCLAIRDEVFKVNCYKKLHTILNKCDKCVLDKQKGTYQSLTYRIVKTEFQRAFYDFDDCLTVDPELDDEGVFEDLDQWEYFTPLV